MHMADALLSPAVAVTMYAASGVTAYLSVRKLTREEAAGRLPVDDLSVGKVSVGGSLGGKLPVMAVTAALVFAGQMINYTIPGTGSSGHLCGGMMLSALLGSQAGFLSMMVILAIQCLFFADGGLMALGANCWNMAFYGCFVGYYLIWRPIMQGNLFGKAGKGSRKRDRLKIITASLLGCILTLQMGAFSVVLETSLSGITELPLPAFAALMRPIHLAIGLVEGLITAAVLLFVYETRPELLLDVTGAGNAARKKASLKTTLIILGTAVVIVGGVASLFASSKPDGLEWALFGNASEGYSENMALDEENFGVASDMADAAAAIQEKTALLPDYSFAGKESKAGTSLSGLLGSAVVGIVAAGIYGVGRFFRSRRRQKQCQM